jgi:DNA-binding IclR family transcriptional regulator
MVSDSTPLQTVQRAFEILHLLRDRGELGVTEIAAELSIPKSTAHDYLRTLRTMGYVVNDAGTYRLGFRFLELGGQAKYRNRLFQVARSELERLVVETQEVVSLNIEERGEFVVVDAEFGESSLRLGVYPGLRIPLHTHAAGKVMMAHFTEETVRAIIDDRGLEPRTEHSITDPDELTAELESIRERGYAVDWNEQIVGMGVVAAPIIAGDEVLGSIGIVCPTDRLRDEDYRTQLVDEVQKSANIVAVNYQYSP